MIPAGKNIKLHDLSLDGNRDAIARPVGLPPSEAMFSRFSPNNGILAEDVTNLEIAQVKAVGDRRLSRFLSMPDTLFGSTISEIADSGGLNARQAQ